MALFDVGLCLNVGYSGADIVLVCKEAAMRPVRKLMAQLAAMDEHLAPVDAQVNFWQAQKLE